MQNLKVHLRVLRDLAPGYCEKCVKPLSGGPVVPEQGSENVGVGTADSMQSRR